jgi:hypothetical protein
VRVFPATGDPVSFDAFARGFTGGTRLGAVVPSTGLPALLAAGAGPGGRGTVNRFRLVENTPQFVDGFFASDLETAWGVWPG